MYIDRLILKDYRNYAQEEICDFSQDINVFLGMNAQGKTNLVEAVSYASLGRSFRGASDGDLVRHGEDFARVHTRFFTGSVFQSIDVAILEGGRKSIKVNGQPVRRMGELMGVANTVVFAPEDIRTVKESPALRRHMLDLEISKMRPAYYRDLQQYMIALKEKNRLLKSHGADARLISAYNAQLAERGGRVMEKRAGFLSTLNAAAGEMHSLLTDGGERPELGYKCCGDPQAAQQSLLEKLERALPRELETGMCFVGPHREDMQILLDGRDARTFASQGQARTAMLAIKLASAVMAFRATGETPVVILDDVFSELDHCRRERLLRALKGYQVLITCTDGEYADMAKIFHICQGRVSR